MKINEILIRPIVTEKTTKMVNNSVYTFEVAKKAGKSQIREALERLYKVKVKKIRVVVRKGKKRKVGKRMVSKMLPDKKIAFIELAEGKIDLFPKA